MIISEDYIKVPGKIYKVKVQCVSTRRLTTMEWLIVNCAAKFTGNSQTATKTLKFVFEEVFQLTSSEILIKPCIESLMKEQAIQLDVGPVFDYSSLMFSQIRLTDKGRRMAEDGLFPGEKKELPLVIYYNPLSEKMNQFVGGRECVKGAIEFGAESDYETKFPEEKITEALQKGLVGSGKFVASKLRIESIECLASQDWDDFVKMIVDVDSQGHVTTSPVIKEESVKSLVTELLFTKEIPANKLSKLVWIEETQPQTILGSGKKMKEAFLDVSRNSSVIGMEGEVYSWYKQSTKAFKHKTIFLWNCKEFGVEKGNESTFVQFPFQFEVAGCVAVSEKNESVSFCKNRYDYDGTEIIVPIAFEDKQIKIGGHTLLDWLEKIIQDNYREDLSYLALYTLRLWAHSEDKVTNLLKKHWNNVSGNQIIEDLRVIAKFCQLLGTEMIKLDEFGESLWVKYESLETGDILDKLSEIARLNCISSGSETQKYILQKIISRTETPKNYNELFVLLQSVGIKSHADALIYDDLISGLYTRELIIDTLKVILEDKYTRLPELFELDRFFNEYVQAIKELEFLVSGLKMFEKSYAEEVEKAIENCADVALIQSYVAEIQAKNAELLNRGINVYTELRNISVENTDNFFNNIEVIKEKVNWMMKEETKAIVSKTQKEGTSEEISRQKMYIIDTCALMHYPELLLYFNDDEFVRIPTKVIDELGKIKDMRNSKYSPELSRTAARLAYDIEKKYLKLFNHNNKVRLMIENADLDLLPEELDKNVPDNQILSVALKYTEWDTVIISDDGVFRLTSRAQNIKAVTGENFIKEHEIYKKSLERWIEKFVKEGGTLNLQPNVVLAKPQIAIQAELEQSNNTAAVISLEESNFGNPAVDGLPIRELKKYLSTDLTEPAIALLQNNGIKTVGQFKAMLPKDAEALKAKGKQTILRNNVTRAIAKFRELMEKSISTDDIPPVDNQEAETEENISVVGDVEEKPIKFFDAENPYYQTFIEAIDSENTALSMSCYEELTKEMNRHVEAVYFREMIAYVSPEYHTKLIRFLMAIYPEWQLRQIVGHLDSDTINVLKKTTDFKTIVEDLVAAEELNKFDLLMSEWNLEVDYKNWFNDISKDEILLKLNSVSSVEKYIEECLGGVPEKVIAFLREHTEVPTKLVVKQCLKGILIRDSFSKEYERLLCEYGLIRNEEGKSLGISVSDVVEIAIAIPEAEEDTLKEIMEKCTNNTYRLKVNKHYAQQDPSPKTLELVTKMISSKLSLSRIIYVYMNTKLRAEINVDRFISELVDAGYAVEEVMNYLKDYWILGRVKYVQEDGLVRVVSESLSNSRLMVFNSQFIHVNGEDGWQSPKEGMVIYFKLKEFKEGGLFYIHYPCTDIVFSN